MLQPGTRVCNTSINRAGVTTSQEYLPDNGGSGFVVDVLYDQPYGNRSTVPVAKLTAEAALR